MKRAGDIMISERVGLDDDSHKTHPLGKQLSFTEVTEEVARYRDPKKNSTYENNKF